ncbi:MAG: FimB/Mfa2 family fimbrial subunit [Alistipes sp.]|nr:FimB/Mfa2 family fimbrial subunit [Alistipes sp.]
MKANRAFLTILAAATLCGCIVDDRSDCYDEDANLILKFEYFDNGGEDIFADRIETVDLIVFDEYKNFYAWVPISQNQLEEFRGYQMAVDPGDYYMVCWANNNSSGNQGSTPDASYVYHSNPETADPLHYAPDKRFASMDEIARTRAMEEGTWKVTVAPSGSTVDTMSFMSAHRTVNVYLKDFPGMNNAAGPQFPEISIENLAEYYDFTLARGPERATFVQTSHILTVEQEWWCYARFYIPHFDYDNNVNVVIRGTGEYTYNSTVTMEEILELHEITEVFDGDDLVLDVEVTYKGDGVPVEISIPAFIVEDVDGGFD